MVEIKNTVVYGIHESIVRSGYPHRYGEIGHIVFTDKEREESRFLHLSRAKSGSGHDVSLKGITVNFDIKYSLYFTKQLQRYHFIDFISSQSTMHSITKRGDIDQYVNKYVDDEVVSLVNNYINKYNEVTKEDKYFYFMKIISNLPSGFELWAGMTTNYLQLKTIYQQRSGHKLKEDWGAFCGWIRSLPLMDQIL